MIKLKKVWNCFIKYCFFLDKSNLIGFWGIWFAVKINKLLFIGDCWIVLFKLRFVERVLLNFCKLGKFKCKWICGFWRFVFIKRIFWFIIAVIWVKFRVIVDLLFLEVEEVIIKDLSGLL